MEQLAVLLAVLGAATALGLALRRRDGRFRTAVPEAPGAQTLDAADVGGPLDPTATFVLVTQPTCATCPQARRVLVDVARSHGVTLREVDAEADPALVRRLGVLRTPTVLLLDARGRIAARSSGALRPEQAVAALAELTGPSTTTPTTRATPATAAVSPGATDAPAGAPRRS